MQFHAECLMHYAVWTNSSTHGTAIKNDYNLLGARVELKNKNVKEKKKLQIIVGL